MESYKFIDGTIAVRKTSLGNNYIYVTYYAFWSKIIFMEAIPYAVIFILNAIIVLKIYDSIKFRKRFVNSKNLSSKRRESASPQLPLVKNQTRRQSSPMLRKKELGGLDVQSRVSFLSTSNLADDNGHVIDSEIPNSVFLSQTSTKVNIKRVKFSKLINRDKKIGLRYLK